MAQVRIKPQDIINEYAVNLGNKLRIKKIILFGSASRGRLGRDSDLDIIVLSEDFKKMGFLKRLELLSRARCGNSRRVAMDIIGYTPSEFGELSKKSAVLGEARQSGKVIWQPQAA